MLTQDLIRYQTFNDTIAPEFINPDNPNLITVVEQLLTVFEGRCSISQRVLLLSRLYAGSRVGRVDFNGTVSPMAWNAFNRALPAVGQDEKTTVDYWRIKRAAERFVD